MISFSKSIFPYSILIAFPKYFSSFLKFRILDKKFKIMMNHYLISKEIAQNFSVQNLFDRYGQ